MTATIDLYIGGAYDLMGVIPDHSANLILTSPPFLLQRAYLPDDAPADLIAVEIGREQNPADYLSQLLRMTGELAYLLAPGGSLALELGDKYAGSGGAGGDYNKGGKREGQGKYPRAAGEGWPMDRSLCMIPSLYAASLAYGRNMLTGEEELPWRVRNFSPWVRTQGRPGADGDKWKPLSSHVTIAAKDHRYWNGSGGDWWAEGDHDESLDWLPVPIERYKGSHYATWPRKLVERLMLAMVPPTRCCVCSSPPGCAHGDSTQIERGTVLDPFSGSGTTLAVAGRLGFDAVGFDLDQRNVELTIKRIHEECNVVHHARVSGNHWTWAVEPHPVPEKDPAQVARGKKLKRDGDAKRIAKAKALIIQLEGQRTFADESDDPAFVD